MATLTTDALVEALRQRRLEHGLELQEELAALREIVPLLQREDLRHVLHLVGSLEGPEPQLRAIESLIDAIPRDAQVPFVELALQRAWQYPELAARFVKAVRQQLTPKQRKDVLARSDRMANRHERFLLLMDLARDEARSARRPFLASALSVLEDLPPGPIDTRDLEDLASGLAGPLHARFGRFIDTLPPSEGRVGTRAVWARRTRNSRRRKVFAQVFEELDALPSHDERAMLLYRIVGWIPTGLYDTFLASARRLEPHSLRFDVLRSFLSSQRTWNSASEAAVAEAFSATSQMEDPHSRAAALTWLAPWLQAGYMGQALTLAATISDLAGRIRVTAALTSAQQAEARELGLRELLALLRDLPSEPQIRVDALRGLVRHLPPELRDQAWALVLPLVGPYTLDLAIPLIYNHPRPVQSLKWMELLDLLLVLEDSLRGPALAALYKSAPHDIRPGLIGRLEASTDPQGRALALAAFWRGAPRAERPSLAKEALSTARSQEPSLTRKTMEELANLLPSSAFARENAAGDMFKRFKASPSIERPRRRRPRPDLPLAQWVPEQLEGALSEVPRDERSALLRQVFRELDAGLRRQGPEHDRQVNLGFSTLENPGVPLPPEAPLRPQSAYLFSVDIGERTAGSITPPDAPFPSNRLPKSAPLTVALFAIDEELRFPSERDEGRLRLHVDGRVLVDRPAHPVNHPIATQRLFFVLQTPKRYGTFRFRCNFYHQNTLLQSWLVKVDIGTLSQSGVRALRATQDFVLSRTLDPAHLAQLPSPNLALMINGDGHDSHTFWYGQDFKRDLHLPVQALKTFVKESRDRLAEASWGGPRPWNHQSKCRYDDGKLDLERLRKDLVRLAIVGFRFFSTFIKGFSLEDRQKLLTLLGTAGSIQVALKDSPQAVLPAAIIYDYMFDTNGRTEDKFQLCPVFCQALTQQQQLETTPCFQTGCLHCITDKGIICPSGFWGFRNELGLTVSTPKLPEVPTGHHLMDTPFIAAGVSTDSSLLQREAHISALREDLEPAKLDCRETREEVLALLKSTEPDLVYFYCHGGVNGTTPYIKVGASTEFGITSDNLFWLDTRWKSRPLVFINGCQSAAVEPEVALDLVSGFIEFTLASGVIGTEITVFEPTARTFAEECLKRFFRGTSIGRAVRDARRVLLEQGNPLGLIYIPFVAPGYRLYQAPGVPAQLQAQSPHALAELAARQVASVDDRPQALSLSSRIR